MSVARTGARPNVIFILSDDHGYADRSALGIDPAVRTPNLDRLAASGVSCTQAYVTAPICSPSRAAIMAGQYQQRWGAKWFDSSAFGEHTTTLAEQFAEQGYATGYFGKVHYGTEDAGDRACPPQHGFAESFYGLAGQQMGRLHYLRHSEQAVAEYGPAATPMGVLPLYDGKEQVAYEGFLTAELGRRAREFVADHAAEPFFCMLAFNAIHNFCFQLPAEELEQRDLPAYGDWDPAETEYLEWYEDVIWPNLDGGREYYLAQLELMDTQIGLLLDELDRRGLAENTIVVYTTDNGGSTCNFGVNTPLRGTKYTIDEGGIRVPFLVRWPGGGITGGGDFEGLTSTMDLYPSLLSAAGAPASAYAHCDGVEQLAGWRGQVAGGHEHLFWDCGFQWAVRDSDWKLSWIEDGPRAADLKHREHASLEPGLRLTRLSTDVGETVNLADQHPDVVARLQEKFTAWQREVDPAAASP